MSRQTQYGDRTASDGTGDTERVRQLGESLLGDLRPGTRIADMCVRDVQVWIFYRLNEGEDARRRACAAGLLSNEAADMGREMSVFRALLGLPARIPVPLSSITERDRRLLRRCPVGSVRVAAGAAERLAVPPVQVDLAMVQAQRLTTGAVSRAGRFGSYAPSTAIRVTGPVVDSLVGLQAEWFGHGVVHDNAVVGCRLVALPRVLTNSRHTEAAWRFSEQVYGRLRPR